MEYYYYRPQGYGVYYIFTFIIVVHNKTKLLDKNKNSEYNKSRNGTNGCYNLWYHFSLYYIKLLSTYNQNILIGLDLVLRLY